MNEKIIEVTEKELRGIMKKAGMSVGGRIVTQEPVTIEGKKYKVKK